ncbi:hypothetical protein D3C86_2247210 [compost metagenome]
MLGTGTENREAERMYSVLPVTKLEPWLPITLGSLRIWWVFMSLRLMRATRLLPLSLTKSQRPS